ncbi:unnamed protein product [Pedinophyceae sp. YPF-701]|nr:unnamed protein product [Pedinophyceae sp. YPF-701]
MGANGAAEPLLDPSTVDGAHEAAAAAHQRSRSWGRPSVGGSSAKGGHAPRPLNVLALIALVFYEVSGGPFGTEDTVRLGGPLVAIVGFAVLPLVWSVPEALVTAELATTFPENSGYVAWVTAAFGPFWGFMEGFWKWVSGVTDNAIYPVLFLSYLQRIFPALAAGYPRAVFLSCFTATLTYLNYRGLSVVGTIAVSLTFATLLPFVAMAVLAAPRIKPANWLRFDWDDLRLGQLINVLFWNLNYWDGASTLAGEVNEPRRTFPRALMAAVVLVAGSYLLPLLTGLGIDDGGDLSEWREGHYADIARALGGKFMQGWVVVAAAVSNIGQFQAEMSADSFQLLGMAERGFLPEFLARRSRHGTPTVAIILSSLGVVGIACLDFLAIMELLNAVYCLAELLEFAAYVKLRISAPDIKRPYAVPLNVFGLILMLLPASALLVFLLVLPVYQRNWLVITYCAASTVAGAIAYHAFQGARRAGLLKFCCAPPTGVEDLATAPWDTDSEFAWEDAADMAADIGLVADAGPRPGAGGSPAASPTAADVEAGSAGAKAATPRGGLQEALRAADEAAAAAGGPSQRSGSRDLAPALDPRAETDHEFHRHFHQYHRRARRTSRQSTDAGVSSSAAGPGGHRQRHSPDTYVGALSEALGITAAGQMAASVVESVGSWMHQHSVTHGAHNRSRSHGSLDGSGRPSMGHQHADDSDSDHQHPETILEENELAEEESEQGMWEGAMEDLSMGRAEPDVGEAGSRGAV